MTPSVHRQTLPQVLHGNGIAGVPSQYASYQQGTPQRTPLQNVNPNMFAKRQSPHMGGMSAGIKVGRPHTWEQRDVIGGVRTLGVR